VQDQIKNIRLQFTEELQKAIKNDAIDELYLKYFSKKYGIITKLLKELPKLSPQKKKTLGPVLNKLRKEFNEKISEAKKEIEHQKFCDPLIDLTYPLPPKESGAFHPITQTTREMNEFFRYYGYSICEGPEIETAEYNFRKLNLPEGHPATDLQDSLFVKEPDILLRPHTSSVEARILSSHKPPIRAVAPGKCYRNETSSAASSAFFHQYQGFVVDKNITIQNLKATLEALLQFLFKGNVKTRFRYKYYPEVSPGMGADVQCKFCEGKGCEVCKHRGWIEVLGSGMIHYNTLKMCGIDPEKYTGFAFGMGLDRLAMSKFGITDIRKMYNGELVYL
jgi:phenylalanyl-tRNA synthetase alpha chain